MRNTFFSRHCAWAAKWPWRTASRQSGADIASNWCILQSKGSLDAAYLNAQRYSAALQQIPGVERAWAQRPGVVYVVLEGIALLQLALDDNAMPWKAPQSERWLVDYGAVLPFQELGLSVARQNVMGDVLSRTLAHAGHKVVRERFAFDEGPNVVVLSNAVQESMQALEGHSGVPAPSATARAPLMQELAEQAWRMEVPSGNQQRIADFASTTMFARQEEQFSMLRVVFDRALQSSHLQSTVADVLDGWRNRGHTDVRDTSVMFHGIAFGGLRDIAAVKSNADTTYFTQRVAHHAEQLAQGFARVISVRDMNHKEMAQNVRLGLEALRIEDKTLSYLLVQPVQQEQGHKMVRHRRQATLHDIVKFAGTNAVRLGLLSVQPKESLHVQSHEWMEQQRHLGRTTFDALNKIQNTLEQHCKGVANMQPGPVAHTAKPLVLALLRWPDCQRMAIETLNPTLIYRHAVELVHLIHKTHANVPMQELDGAALEAMGTLWALTELQLQTLLDLMGMDVLEWQLQAEERKSP